MPDDSSTVLPLRLEELLYALADRALAERLRRVYEAAARAIARLSDMDLLRYETVTVEALPDLTLWEDMAPVIREMLVDVNALLNVLREQLAEEPGASRQAREVAELLRGGMEQLAQGVTQMGEVMRNPVVVADRWTLLAEIQRARARFREQIANLVYESASAFGQVLRHQVVPGHEAEVKAAVVVRAIVADLGRIVAARLEKVREGGPDEARWNAQQLRMELDAFGRTGAYRNLRAQDKRRIIELRARVTPLADSPRVRHEELLELMRELDEFVRGLYAVNQRQLLILHDKDVCASCWLRLERALAQVQVDPAGAARMLAEAAATAQSLYGKDPALDAFLRNARKAPLAELVNPEVRSTLEAFQVLLSRLDAP